MTTASMQRRGGSGSYVQLELKRALRRARSDPRQGPRDRRLRAGLAVGIEILTIDARIVIASVDTYLRFAQAVNRLDLEEKGGKTLPEMMSGIVEGGAKSKTKGAIEGAKESLFGSDGKDEDPGERQPAERSSASRR